MLAFLVFRPFETLPSYGHYSSESYWFKPAGVEYNQTELAIENSATIAVGVGSAGHDDCPAVLTANGMLVTKVEGCVVEFQTGLFIGLD